jgi:ABC-2 type transport system ATP-binding protein
MHQLILHDLQKSYSNGIKALDGISLTIRNGMFGLLGPNGAGKSTLMKTIAGLQAPDKGSIHFNGVDTVADPSAIKRQLGFLPQDFGVYPKVSAYFLLDHLAHLKGLQPAAARKEQVLALLAQTNLYAQRHQDVHTFSGGMRQRFGIAQALLGQPRIVIVDEPTAGLDPEERNRFNNLLCEIGQEIVVILSTHIVEDVQQLCDDMAILHKGMIIAQGKPQALTDALDGQIWQKRIAKEGQTAFEARHQVLSSHLAGGRRSLRIRAAQLPDEGCQPAAPLLEDVYFSFLQQGGLP